jgi:hypothetical protein
VTAGFSKSTHDSFFKPPYDANSEDSEANSWQAATERASLHENYTLSHSPAPFPDPDIPESDATYLYFFLAEMPKVLPYVNIFPSAIQTLFQSSLVHPAQRHGLLSISALIADRKTGKGKERSFTHLQKSLSFLRNSLSITTVDEGVAISVFFLAYCSVLSGEHLATRKHLDGLRLVLEQLRTNHLLRNAGIRSPRAISPLSMLVWRMAIRLDFILAVMYSLTPIFAV